MSDHEPHTLQEELEVRIIALLTGELPESEADELEKILSVDEALVDFRDRMARLIGDVHAARDEITTTPAHSEMRLSPERRREIFTDEELFDCGPSADEEKKKWWRMGLLELVAVFAIAGVLAAIMIPSVGAVRKQSADAQARSNARSAEIERQLAESKFEAPQEEGVYTLEVAEPAAIHARSRDDSLARRESGGIASGRFSSNQMIESEAIDMSMAQVDKASEGWGYAPTDASVRMKQQGELESKKLSLGSFKGELGAGRAGGSVTTQDFANLDAIQSGAGEMAGMDQIENDFAFDSARPPERSRLRKSAPLGAEQAEIAKDDSDRKLGVGASVASADFYAAPVDAFAAPRSASKPMAPPAVVTAPTGASSSNASGPVDPFAASGASSAGERATFFDTDTDDLGDVAIEPTAGLRMTGFRDISPNAAPVDPFAAPASDSFGSASQSDEVGDVLGGQAVATLEGAYQGEVTQLSAVEAMAAARLKNTSQTPKAEKQTQANPISTFSLNVSDVSFKLAQAALASQRIPAAELIRTEEFVNSFNYGDPAPRENEPVTLNWEIAQHPYQHNRQIVRFSLQTQAAGRAANQPLNLNLLVDNSGSMQRPDRRAILEKSLESLQSKLTDQDQLNIVLFARQPTLIASASNVHDQKIGIERALNAQPQGGTNLESGLQVAYNVAQRSYDPTASNRVILMTDGAANLGDVDSSSLAQMVVEQRKQGIALDAYGIGWEDYNDALLEEITRNGDGRYAFLNSVDSAAEDFAEKLAGTLRVAAADVKVQILWNPERVTAYRQIGYDLHQLRAQDFRDNTVDAAEIGEAESGTALYVLQINDDPEIAGGLGKLQVRYRVPATGEYIERAWPLEMPRKVPALQDAPASLRLAAASALFAERLANNPYAGNYSFEDLEALSAGLPEAFPTQARVSALQNMIQSANALFTRLE